MRGVLRRPSTNISAARPSGHGPMGEGAMRVNAELVAELRKKCAWSQDELATAAGLNVRTIQRIENVGTASLQSAKALASALEVELEDLRLAEKTVTKFEYKTVVLPFKFGIFKRGLPDVESALNKEGRDGWQFKQMVVQASSNLGESVGLIPTFERSIE
jgi:transcriptional regulator with XRE-family HTH domain